MDNPPRPPGSMRSVLRDAILAERETLERSIRSWENLFDTCMKSITSTNMVVMRPSLTPQDALGLLDKIVQARRRLTELAGFDTD